MTIHEHYPLQRLTTFGTAATARRYLRLDREVEPLLASGLLDSDYLILGGGSNIVFTRDYPGTVIQLAPTPLSEFKIQNSKFITGAGLQLDALVAHCVDRGLGGGIENLSAIPGTVGGAVVQNAGAYGVETGEFVDRVDAVDLHERRRVTLSRQECRFAYRTSLFKEQPGRYLILEVHLRFATEFAPVLRYKALADELQRRGLTSPTQRQMRDLITSIRWAKLPRPEEHGSAGSFFKNPVVDRDTYLRLRAAYPDMPEAHPTPPDNNSTFKIQNSELSYKLSAGWLIDRAGWKGRTLGRAGVWPRQALVLYNTGGCTGQDLLALAQAIQADVLNKFSVQLTPEAILI